MGNEKLTTLARRLRPFFLWQMESSLPFLISEGPDIDLVGTQIGRGGDLIITFDTGGNPVAEYAATSAGLELALLATAPVIWLYGYTIDGNHTIPADKHVIGNQRDTSILSGQIVCESGSSLENLSVIRAVNNASILDGVLGPTTGSAKLLNCRISVAQSGAGNAYAVSASRGLVLGGGNIYVHYCELEATSTGGAAYCGRSIAGELYLYHGKADIFTTGRFTTI